MFAISFSMKLFDSVLKKTTVSKNNYPKWTEFQITMFYQ